MLIEIHKRQLSLLHAVISSGNKCLRDVVQRQLACSFNNEYSFFYILAHVLEQYNLPTLSSLIATEIGKEQWKIQCKKAVALYWMNMFVDDIKSKKTEISVRAGITCWSFTPGVAESRDSISSQKGCYKGKVSHWSLSAAVE